MEFEKPQRAIQEIMIQGGVLCAAERMYGRYQRVIAAIQAMAERHKIATAGTTDFNDFLNMAIVRGLVAYAPVLTEEERQCGLLERFGDADIGLFRRAIANELQGMAKALDALEKNLPGKISQRVAGQTIQSAADLLITSAQMAALAEKNEKSNLNTENEYGQCHYQDDADGSQQ